MSDQDNLTPAERELESALRSLRPTPARINPVAAALAAGRCTADRRAAPVLWRHWQVAAVAATVAAAATAWLTLAPRTDAPDNVVQHAPVIAPNVAVASRVPVEPPTLLVYRRALAHSPAELNELLDRQATLGAEPHDQFTPVGVYTLWKTDLNSPLGKM